MNAKHPSHQTVLITGASTGIGYELAKLFARDGYQLFLVARNREKLESLAESLKQEFGTRTYVFPQDLSVPGAVPAILREVSRNQLTVDILVNNAGIGLYGMFAELSLEKQLAMMQLNMTSLAQLTRELVCPMKSRGYGRILNVASTAAFQPGPLMAVYYATKAFVLSFSEAIAEELQSSGVSVTCLCPGPTRSEFQKNAEMGNIWLFSLNLMDSAVVAKAGYEGLMQSKRLVIPGILNWLAAFSVRISPRRFVTWVVSRVQQRID